MIWNCSVIRRSWSGYQAYITLLFTVSISQLGLPVTESECSIPMFFFFVADYQRLIVLKENLIADKNKCITVWSRFFSPSNTSLSFTGCNRLLLLNCLFVISVFLTVGFISPVIWLKISPFYSFFLNLSHPCYSFWRIRGTFHLTESFSLVCLASHEYHSAVCFFCRLLSIFAKWPVSPFFLTHVISITLF